MHSEKVKLEPFVIASLTSISPQLHLMLYSKAAPIELITQNHLHAAPNDVMSYLKYFHFIITNMLMKTLSSTF